MTEEVLMKPQPATQLKLQQPPRHVRYDWTSARFVEEGITIQVVYGTRHAATFLRNRMIDIDVALRVLLTPAQRRSYAPR